MFTSPFLGYLERNDTRQRNKSVTVWAPRFAAAIETAYRFGPGWRLLVGGALTAMPHTPNFVVNDQENLFIPKSWISRVTAGAEFRFR